MLVTYDKDPEHADASYIELYEVFADHAGKEPELRKRWNFPDCRGLNSALRTDPASGGVYPHFAVACENGDLLLGTFKKDMSQSELHKARTTPAYVRRALHLDTRRGASLCFCN